MSRRAEEILSDMLGKQQFQIAVMQAKIEELMEQVNMFKTETIKSKPSISEFKGKTE